MSGHSQKPTTTALAASVLAIVAGAPVATFAADAPDATDTIVVTGHLTPTPSSALGSAVTVIDAEEIVAKQTVFLSDILRDVPGAAVSRSGPNGQLTQIRIRGAEANHTLVLIDGVEANDPAIGAEFNFANLPAFDVDRLEVLRGPQSALWGSEAIGGVVNILTPDPEPGFSADAEVEGGSFGTWRAGAAIAGGDERLRGRASLSYFDTDGVSASPTGAEKDGYRNLTVHARGVFDITPDVQATGVVRFVDSETESDAQDFTFGSPTQGLIIDSDEASEIEQLFARASLAHAALDGAWRNSLSLDFARTSSDFLAGGVVTNGNVGERFKIDLRSSYFFETGPVAHTATVSYQRDDLDFENTNANPLDPSVQTRSDEQNSFVGEYGLGFSERVFVSGAVRFDDNDLFEEAVTYRATAAWVFPETNTKLHASVGKGVNNPGFFELFGFIPATFSPNPDLEPERSFGFDVGVEQQFWNDRARIDVTYFDADLEDEIFTTFQFDPVQNAFVGTPLNDIGTSERKGVETALTVQATDWLSLSGQYTYLDAEDPSGEAEVRRANHIASASATVSFWRDRGAATVTARYNGEQEDNEFIFATPQTRVTLDDYILVNIAASFKLSSRFEIFARGENTLDEDYQDVFGFNTAGAAGFVGLRASY